MSDHVWPEACSTCGEPYVKPARGEEPVFCSDGFHSCRDCLWHEGVRVRTCADCAGMVR